MSVDVETLGGAAAVLGTLRGLKDWAGFENAGVPFGGGAAFSPAHGLGDAQDRALRVAWSAVGRVDEASVRYASGVASAADEYGSTDRHSASAIDAAARGMTDPGLGAGGS
ncbi:MAG: hypothetical protein ACRDT6_00125 [Micromonosporaceae bacterium]